MSDNRKHQEPWHVDGDAVCYSTGSTVVESPWTYPGDSLARIVACVNALAGIPTAALEAGALDGLMGSAMWFARRPESGDARDDAEALDDLRAALRSLGRLP